MDMPPINFIDIYDEILNPKAPIFLIDGMIEDITTGIIFGETGSGKTFVALSLACSVVTGEPWAGHNVNRQGPVIYFAGEGRQGIYRRVAAWEKLHGVAIPAGNLFRPEGIVEFSSQGAKMVTEAVDLIADQHGTPAMIVIDTMARALPADSDENSNKDMRAFIKLIDNLRDRYSCVAVIVHHTGHRASERLRGSSSIKAAMDWEYFVDRGKFKCTKMKDAEEPPEISYKLESIGNSAVVIFGGAIKSAGPKLAKYDKVALAILGEESKKHGDRLVSESDWREIFLPLHHHESKDTNRKAFERARDNLMKAGLVHFDGERFSVLGQSGQSGTSPG